MRTYSDLRPGAGYDDQRNPPSESMDYQPNSGGNQAGRWPGDGGKSSPLLHGSEQPYENTIRSVRVGEVPDFGNRELGNMELAGRSQAVKKVPAMVSFPSKPLDGPGPLEMQQITQRQNNAIAMQDPDYGPFRELDYESAVRSNFQPAAKNAQRKDSDFGH